MTIALTPNHFARREQAIEEIEAAGLFLTEAELSPNDLSATPHTHPYDVDIYLLEGVMELREPDTGRTHVLEAGSRAVVPAETLHAEYSPGPFRAAFGVSVDPKTIMAARA
jgi:quercetin dioxygenase-like cupin family protein